MPTMQHTWEILDDAGEAVFAIEIEVDYTISNIVPAVTYGPPERCHPEEGGDCDVDAVRAKTIGKYLAAVSYWSPQFPITGIERDAFAHLFEQQHDVEQLCRDHAEAEYQGHVERKR